MVLYLLLLLISPHTLSAMDLSLRLYKQSAETPLINPALAAVVQTASTNTLSTATLSTETTARSENTDTITLASLSSVSLLSTPITSARSTVSDSVTHSSSRLDHLAVTPSSDFFHSPRNTQEPIELTELEQAICDDSLDNFNKQLCTINADELRLKHMTENYQRLKETNESFEQDYRALKTITETYKKQIKEAFFYAIQLRKIGFIRLLLTYNDQLAYITNNHKDTPLVHLLKTYILDKGLQNKTAQKSKRVYYSHSAYFRQYEDTPHPVEDAERKAFDEILRLLSEYEVSPDALNHKGENALILAALYFEKSVIFTLLYRSKKPGEFLLWLAQYSTFGQFDEMVDLYQFNLNYKNEKDITALHLCAESGSVNKINKLLRHNATLDAKKVDIDAKDQGGCTPFMRAISKKQIPCVQLLIENGCNIDETDTHGCDALIYALSEPHEDTSHHLVTLLVKQKALSKQGKPSYAHLHAAASAGCNYCTQVLIEAGADFRQTDSDGNLFLIHAFHRRKYEYIGQFLTFLKTHVRRKKFIKCINHKNSAGETLLMLAAKEGNNDFINLLFSFNSAHESNSTSPKLGFDVALDIQNNGGYTALMLALVYNHLSTAELLLEAGSDISRLSSDGQTAYSIADNKSHTEFALMLKSIEQMPPQARLFWAAQHGYKNHINELASDIAYSSLNPLDTHVNSPVEREFDVTLTAYHSTGWTALMLAAANDDARMIVTLTNVEAEISQRERLPSLLTLKTRAPDMSGSTALIIAAQKGKLLAVRALLGMVQAYDDLSLTDYLDMKDNFGKTAFSYAAEQNNTELMHYLVSKDCHVDVVDAVGDSPFMKAVREQKNHSVKNLIVFGSQKNQRDMLGKTALMIALQNYQNEMADVLLASGVDINCLDRTGKSAFSIALEQGDIFLMVRLKRLGAYVSTPYTDALIANLLTSTPTVTNLNGYLAALFDINIESNRAAAFVPFNREKIVAEIAQHLQHMDNTLLDSHIYLLNLSHASDDAVKEQLLRDCSLFNYTKRPRTLLMTMALCGIEQAIEALLHQTPYIEQTFNGKTTLKYINAQDLFGRTALMYALLTKNWPIIRLLTALKRGAASLHKSSEFIELTLCESGIFLRDNEGNSAIEYAVATGDVEIVKHILLATAFAYPPTSEKPRAFRFRKRAVLLAFQLGHTRIGLNLLYLYFNLPSEFSSFGKIFGGSQLQSNPHLKQKDKTKSLTMPVLPANGEFESYEKYPHTLEQSKSYDQPRDST